MVVVDAADQRVIAVQQDLHLPIDLTRLTIETRDAEEGLWIGVATKRVIQVEPDFLGNHPVQMPRLHLQAIEKLIAENDPVQIVDAKVIDLSFAVNVPKRVVDVDVLVWIPANSSADVALSKSVAFRVAEPSCGGCHTVVMMKRTGQ